MSKTTEKSAKPAAVEEALMVEEVAPTLIKSTASINPAGTGHDPRFKPSKKVRLLNSFYYVIPVLVVLALFIAHRLISTRNREDVLSQSKTFDRWKNQKGTRTYFFNSTKATVFNFQVEKRNIELLNDEASFDLFRRWTLQEIDFDEYSKSVSYILKSTLTVNSHSFATALCITIS